MRRYHSLSSSYGVIKVARVDDKLFSLQSHDSRFGKSLLLMKGVRLPRDSVKAHGNKRHLEDQLSFVPLQMAPLVGKVAFV